MHLKEDDILDELKKREPIFHHPDQFGRRKEDILNMMCDNFWEVGASGNVYTRDDVVETLLQRYANPHYQDIWRTEDFKCAYISDNHYLITYVLFQENRMKRRTTLWRFEDKCWKILYHQGTVVQEKK